MADLAPIMVSTYSRLSHLKKTIRALQKNTLAKQSNVFVYSDAAKRGDEDKIALVREYLRSIAAKSGFKKLTIIERKTNSRVYNNREGIAHLLAKYGRMIFLEDDIETAPGFMAFMNAALDTYRKDPKILSVSGYLPPINTSYVTDDCLFLKRFSGWGVGFWAGKYEDIQEIQLTEYKKLLGLPNELNRLNQEYGEDLLNRFRAEAYGHLDGVDNRACYLQFQNKLFSVHPKQSLVNNTGNDGSGVHSSINNKFDVSLWKKVSHFNLTNQQFIDQNIDKQIVDFYRPDHRDMSPTIIENILQQLISAEVHSVCLWGTDILTEIMLEEIHHHPIKIQCVMDSWAEKGQSFKGYELITPAQAIEQGERDFVILSFASRLKMKLAAEKMSSELRIFMYQE
jgi:hypothetical protein